MMNGWRIDVDGVRSVLASVVTTGEALSTYENHVSGFTDDAAGVCGPATRVAGALGRVLSAHADDVAGAAARSRRVLDAASLATQGYIAADETMARQTQASAVGAFSGLDPRFG